MSKVSFYDCSAVEDLVVRRIGDMRFNGEKKRMSQEVVLGVTFICLVFCCKKGERNDIIITICPLFCKFGNFFFALGAPQVASILYFFLQYFQ